MSEMALTLFFTKMCPIANECFNPFPLLSLTEGLIIITLSLLKQDKITRYLKAQIAQILTILP